MVVFDRYILSSRNVVDFDGCGGFRRRVLLFNAVLLRARITTTANDTFFPLLLCEVILTGEVHARSTLRWLCWMTSYFFRHRYSAARHRSHDAFFLFPADFVWHVFFESERKLMHMLTRGWMVTPHTMHFVLTLAAMETNFALASVLTNVVYLSVLYTVSRVFYSGIALNVRPLLDSSESLRVTCCSRVTLDLRSPLDSGESLRGGDSQEYW